MAYRLRLLEAGSGRGLPSHLHHFLGIPLVFTQGFTNTQGRFTLWEINSAPVHWRAFINYGEFWASCHVDEDVDGIVTL